MSSAYCLLSASTMTTSDSGDNYGPIPPRCRGLCFACERSMKHSAKLVLLVTALTMAELGAARAEAAMITWHWAGPVSGHSTVSSGPTLDAVVPLGTPVGVVVSFDSVPSHPNPDLPCLWGRANASLEVLGQTYTNQGFIWVDGQGFGGGVCGSPPPGSSHSIEIVVPGWGFGGPALPGGWEPLNLPPVLPGLWWGGDLTVQPTFIGSQFPNFYLPGLSAEQRFTANLQAVPAVPEPSTWVLLSTGLSWVAWRRRRQ
jgi:hypothetical protein